MPLEGQGRTQYAWSMLRFLIRLTVMLISLGGVAAADDQVFIGDEPLPEDTATAFPDDSPFTGAWVGQWDNRRNHILIVEGVGADGVAQVIYAVGSDINNRGRWFRRTARIDGNTLAFADDGFTARYSISPTGRMRGVFADDRGFAILNRRDLTAVMADPSPDWFSVGDVGRLETDLIEGGDRIELAVVTYRPKGDGPFPLALIHHGSTGSGKHPRDFRHVWSSDWFADVLNAHGWFVAILQRRGRGGSDGLYDEGFAEDRSRGYATEAALSLPGADRALRDANAALASLRSRADVSAGPILLGGVSRGGVVAILQAGDRPDRTTGVINFVGGWVDEATGEPSINPTLFRRIGSFSGPVLSIYGEEDPYYSIAHSRSNVAELAARGADSEFHTIKLPGYGMGHWAMFMPSLWEGLVTDWLDALE